MSRGSIRVRVATAADVPALRELIPTSVRALSRGYYSDAQIESAIRHVFGMTAGGRDNGPPGPRPQYHETYYAAYLIDPDGNNVEAVHHG